MGHGEPGYDLPKEITTEQVKAAADKVAAQYNERFEAQFEEPSETDAVVHDLMKMDEWEEHLIIEDKDATVCTRCWAKKRLYPQEVPSCNSGDRIVFLPCYLIWVKIR